MNPAPFVHSALAMTRRLKRRDRCPLAWLLDVWKWPIPTENQPSPTRRLLGANQKWLTYSQIDADDPRQLSRKRARYSNSLALHENTIRMAVVFAHVNRSLVLPASGVQALS
jgi:hypothetical protein